MDNLAARHFCSPDQLAIDLTVELMQREPGPNGIELTEIETKVWRANAYLRRLINAEPVVDHRGRRLNAPLEDH